MEERNKMTVNSEWNMAVDTLMRISKGLHICNDALFMADFGLWIRGLYHLYGELSTWMSAADQEEFFRLLEPCKGWRSLDLQSNLDCFLLCSQFLRRVAHRNKLLLRESENTMNHGGNINAT